MTDEKLNEEASSEQNANEGIKTTAVDTGRRINVEPTLPKERKTIRRNKPRDLGEKKLAKPVSHKENPKPKAQENDVVLSEPKEILERKPASSPKPTSLIETVEFDDSGDFAAMLEESEQNAPLVAIKLGDKLSGKIVHLGQDYAFISVNSKLEAAIATSELRDAKGLMRYNLGDVVSGYVSSLEGGISISNQVAQSGLDEAMLEEALHKQIAVEGKILSSNKGGFEVQISQKRAFCPIGQVDIRFVEDPSSFIGKTLAFLVQRIEEGGRNIVVSRRALLEKQRRDQALETIKTLEVGKKYDAIITRVADFGAFADIGGLEGLIPRSEISHGRFDKVSEMVSSNDRVEVVVLSFEINPEDISRSKLSFSLKKTKEDPYKLHWSKISEGATLEGRVVRLENFGAFVELFPGIDGLIHISELSESKVAHPREILSINDPVTVRVVSISEEEKRIGLSLREQVQKKKAHSQGQSEHIHLERGQKASGTVARIERYGVFLELENGVTALLPQSETGLPKNSDLGRAFKIGESIDVAIIDVDMKNRVRVSALAREQMEERDSFLDFHHKEKAKSSGFGTFADLLKKRG